MERFAIHVDSKEEMQALAQRNFIEQEERSRKKSESEIGYGECANALLKMWVDNVITDGEMHRIVNKLKKFYGKNL